MEHNHLEASVEKHLYFAKDMLNAIHDYFHEIKEVYFQDETRTVKIFRDDQNERIDILYQDGDEYHLYNEKIDDIDKKKTTEEILYYFKKSLLEKKEKIYANLVLSGNLKTINENKKVNVNVKEINQMLSNPWTEENQKKLTSFKKEYEIKYESFMKRHIEKEKYLSNSTRDIGLLKTYYDLLKKKNYMRHTYNSDFFKMLNEKNAEDYVSYIDDIFIDMQMMLKATQKYNYTETKRFWYNDSEYSLWQDNGKLILSDQNCKLMIDMENIKNFTIYFIDTMSSLKDDLSLFKERLENNEINDFTDIALKVENGKIELCNAIGMYIAKIDIEAGAEELIKTKKCKREYPVDMNTYEYQKNYFCSTFRKTELDFLITVFLEKSLFNYSLKQGVFKSILTSYQSDLPEESFRSQPKEIVLKKCNPKKFTYLNNDWLEGLKFFVEILKKERPIPLEYDEKSPEEALDKAIKYFEKRIISLENQPLVQP